MRFQVLDGWRGIAALCVVLFHFEAANDIRALSFVRNSYLFVDFFFVLSGFVIAHAYGNRLRSPLEASQFIVRRFGRVWPLHIAVLGVFVGLETLKYALISNAHVTTSTAAFAPDGSTPLATLPFQILLLQSTGLADSLTWNTPSWSISAEFWTYMLFALAMVFQPHYRPVIFAMLAILGVAILTVFAQHGMDATYDLGLPRCIFGFFLGCLVYWVKSQNAARLHPVGSELIAVAAIIAFVSTSGRTDLSFAAPLVFAAAVYIFSFEAGPVSRLLAHRSFQALGRWSYSIYMVQALIVFIIGLAVSELQRRLGVTLWKNVIEDGTRSRLIVSDHTILLDLLHLAYVLSVIAVAAVTYRWIEEPSRQYFKRLSDRLAAQRERSDDIAHSLRGP